MDISTVGDPGIFAATNGTDSYIIERTGTYMELTPIGP
jgi:hypothetical protein